MFEADLVQGSLEETVDNMPGYKKYDRAMFDKVMKEHNFERSGAVNDNQIREMGDYAGVDYIFVPSVASKSGYVNIVVRCIDIKLGESKTLQQLSSAAPPEIQKACAKLAERLLGGTSIPGTSPGNNSSTARQPTKKNEVLIYGQPKNDRQFCDGKYADKEEFFSVNLGEKLNRKHFRIVFRFDAMDNKGTWWAKPVQYPLVLSGGWRVLAICLHDDGSINITTNNQRHEYSTGLRYSPREGKEIDLEYNNGVVTINGVVLNVEMNEYNGDNELSSINYSNGNAFHGYIYSVRVYNIND